MVQLARHNNDYDKTPKVCFGVLCFLGVDNLNDIIVFLREVNYVTICLRLSLAIITGGIIGNERGKLGSAAGLRTHMLICIGAAMTSLTSTYLSVALGATSDIARISAQVISGIGFLGAGTIMVRNSSVITGLTTAAGMWATAAIGIAAGYGFYWGAIFATLICIVSVTMLGKAERKQKSMKSTYIEISDILKTQEIVDIVQSFGEDLITYDIIPAKSGNHGNVGIMCAFKNEKCHKVLKEEIGKMDSTLMVVCDVNV